MTLAPTTLTRCLAAVEAMTISSLLAEVAHLLAMTMALLTLMTFADGSDVDDADDAEDGSGVEDGTNVDLVGADVDVVGAVAVALRAERSNPFATIIPSLNGISCKPLFENQASSVISPF